MKNSILRNSIFMGLFNLFGRASGFIRYVLLVGLLTEADFDLVALAFGFGRIGRHFMDGGLDNLVSRDGARDPGKLPAFHANALALKMALAAVFFACAHLYLGLVLEKTWREIGVIYIALLGSALTSLAGVIRSCFTAIERMEYILYTNLPSRAASIALLALFLWLALPLEWVMFAVSLENALWFVLLGSISLRFFPPAFKSVSRSSVRYMVSESWTLALYGFFNIFYLSLDVIMIDYFLGAKRENAVAPYSYASLLVEGVTLLLTSYFVAVYPALSRLYVTDFAAYQTLFRRSFTALLTFTIPVSVLMGAWADLWMNAVKETPPVTTTVMQILSANLNLSMLNTFLIVVFTSCNRQRLLVLFTAIAVTVSFSLNCLLIVAYEQPGAAMASLISQAALLIIMGAFARRLLRLGFPPKKPLALMALSLIAAGLAQWVPGVPRAAEPALYLLALPAMAVGFGVYSTAEVRRLLGLFRKKTNRDTIDGGE